MSVSKSVTSAVCGSLVAAGRLSPDGSRDAAHPGARWHVVGRLHGSAPARHARRHALQRGLCRPSGRRPSLRADLPVAAADRARASREHHRLLPDARNQGPHGGPFDYRSILTDMLAWVMERAAGDRLANLISALLWQPMGAEFDAEITVDAQGNPMADGGICTSLRDLARFGQLLANRGWRNGVPVIPEPWIDDTLRPGPDSVEAFLGKRAGRRAGPARVVLPKPVLGLRSRGADLSLQRDQRPERPRARPGRGGDREVLDLARRVVGGSRSPTPGADRARGVARGLGRASARTTDQAAGTWRPASAASTSALSVRSQGRSRSSRPKWPYAAVWR